MNRRDDRQYMPDEQQALDSLRGLEQPRASSAARTRTRAAFVAGEMSPDVAEVRFAQAPRSRARLWVPLAVAACLAVAIVGMWQYASGPRAMWQVTDVVEADGVAGAPTMGMLTTTGQVTTGPASEFELQLGRTLRFRMLPGADVDVPQPPRRWRPEPLVITVRTGEIYGTTGGEAVDVPLRIVATEAIADVFGTTFAVFEVEEGTCVCLWAGHVTVTNRHDGDTFDLVPETKFYVYRDGSVSGALPIDDMERMKLNMMAEGGMLELGD